jgi:hypothetical protein
VLPRHGTWFMRTDVRYLSKRELFTSSLQFFLAGLLTLAVLAVFVVVVLLFPRMERHMILMGLSFLFEILTGMAFMGALYMFIRGCFRSRSYNPERVWQEDRARFLERTDSE